MNTWEPIETAPKDGTEIILGFAHEANIGPVALPRVRSGKWLQTHGEWSIAYLRGNPPTHWMPLPKPPTAPDPASSIG